MLSFTYTDAKGKTSERVVYPDTQLDRILVLDLTEFDQEERDFYAEELAQLHEAYLESVKELGLGSNWRIFKLAQIKNVVHSSKKLKDVVEHS